MASDPHAVHLVALADSLAEAIPRGAEAIAAALAGDERVARSENRAGRDGAIVWVTVTLSAASRATIDSLNDTLCPRALPPPPQLTSPSNVPPHAWGELPVYFSYARPWGELACEHAHGDGARRVRSMIVKRARGR